MSQSSSIQNPLPMQSSPTPGPDGIPTCILRHCSENISGPLMAIFNKSIELDYFPTVWKKSFIISLFKAGNKLEVSNYRGISKLNAIPKLFEKLFVFVIKYFQF